jgi:hypothetical protein
VHLACYGGQVLRYDRKRRHAPDPNPTARTFENYALKSMDACAPSSSRLSSTFERKPKLVRYIPDSTISTIHSDVASVWLRLGESDARRWRNRRTDRPPGRSFSWFAGHRVGPSPASRLCRWRWSGSVMAAESRPLEFPTGCQESPCADGSFSY